MTELTGRFGRIRSDVGNFLRQDTTGHKKNDENRKKCSAFTR